jgi:hypothetical protein
MANALTSIYRNIKLLIDDPKTWIVCWWDYLRGDDSINLKDGEFYTWWRYGVRRVPSGYELYMFQHEDKDTFYDDPQDL